jgi:hypothetical protein
MGVSFSELEKIAESNEEEPKNSLKMQPID